MGPGLLWIHGGYLIGSPGQDDELCRRYVRELGTTVASVDYRLAPESQHPVPLEDCYAALKHLAEMPTVDGSRVAVAGASAGGGLAAALVQLTHDRGELPLRAQLLAYPMLDDRTSERTDLDQSGLRLWDRASNRFAWAAYLGNADPNVAVPARRADLVGCRPPGSASARSISFTMRTSSTPNAYAQQACPVIWRSYQGSSTASMASHRRPRCRKRSSPVSARCCGGHSPRTGPERASRNGGRGVTTSTSRP